MRSLKHWPLFVLIIFVFQNCGTFEAQNFEFYSYSEQPEFFYDVKLVESRVHVDGRRSLSFDAVFTYVRDASFPVDYHFAFSALNSADICDPVSGTGKGEGRSVQFSCRIPADDVIFIEMILVEAQSGTREQKIFRF